MNQNPEKLACDMIDSDLIRSGWVIQNKNQINLNERPVIAIKEYQTDIAAADDVLIVKLVCKTFVPFFTIFKPLN